MSDVTAAVTRVANRLHDAGLNPQHVAVDGTWHFSEDPIVNSDRPVSPAGRPRRLVQTRESQIPHQRRAAFTRDD